MPPLGLKSCCINVVCCDALSLFHISQAEESVREPPNPSICWYWVVASTVTTRPLEIPPLANETLGCGCSSLVLSPVVSTICTVGPPGVVCVLFEPGQLLIKRQAVPISETVTSLEMSLGPSRMSVRIYLRTSGKLMGPCSDIARLIADHSLNLDVSDQNLMPVKSPTGLDLPPAAGLGYP